jgi:uncharacterized iron-regulated protein
MKKLLTLVLLILLIFGLAAEISIIKAESGARLDAKSLGKDLRAYDVIFFGEWHGDQHLHQLQSQILPGLLDDERELILSFEMWERDTQEHLDAFVAREMPEEEFTRMSRAWPNYRDYRPLLIFAQKQNLKAVAANIPRIYANRTAKEGWDFVKTLPPEERAWIASELTAPDDDYRQAFFETMGNMSGHPLNQESLQSMYMAQCIKDDTMAESIALALRNSPKARVIHFNGDFHSRSFLGTVSRLQNALPDKKIAVITPQVSADTEALMQKEDAGMPGTHLILMPDTPEEEGK